MQRWKTVAVSAKTRLFYGLEDTALQGGVGKTLNPSFRPLTPKTLIWGLQNWNRVLGPILYHIFFKETPNMILGITSAPLLNPGHPFFLAGSLWPLNPKPKPSTLYEILDTLFLAGSLWLLSAGRLVGVRARRDGGAGASSGALEGQGEEEEEDAKLLSWVPFFLGGLGV